MVKVLDPDGIIIGVYKSASDVPDRVGNRMLTYYYPKEDCDIVEVTDPQDRERLQSTLERCESERVR